MPSPKSTAARRGTGPLDAVGVDGVGVAALVLLDAGLEEEVPPDVARPPARPSCSARPRRPARSCRPGAPGLAVGEVEQRRDLQGVPLAADRDEVLTVAVEPRGEAAHAAHARPGLLAAEAGQELAIHAGQGAAPRREGVEVGASFVGGERALG